MAADQETYRQKALEACAQVFYGEYFSLGLPLPQIAFMFPDDPHYRSGEYFIEVGDTWQIHLHFGLLQKNFREFQEEVKVLTRHEIEHYMCCPFDVLTHLRMIKTIIKTYSDHYKELQLDIISLAASIANQAADVIIDTKLFRKHPEATLKSERAWIRKSGRGEFGQLPRHAKQLFLTKEALWEENLELYEKDEQLQEEIHALAALMNERGITNEKQFIEKTKAYAHAYFKLYQIDLQEQQGGGGEGNGTGGARPQSLPSRDAQSGSQLVYQLPDRIQEALMQLAQESTLEEFMQVLVAAGVTGLSEKEKQRKWFDAQHAELFPLEETIQSGENESYAYPVNWRVGDPVDELDLMLSYTTSPKLIPGITTKKWVQDPVLTSGSEQVAPDLLLVLDSSGSMGSILEPTQKLHQAVLACFGLLKYFESRGSSVALLNFSDSVTRVDWTRSYKEVKEALFLEGGGGTRFPHQEIKELLITAAGKIVTVLITDGAIQNRHYAKTCLQQSLQEGNKLYMFIQDAPDTREHFQSLETWGAKIYSAIEAEDIRMSVLNNVS